MYHNKLIGFAGDRIDVDNPPSIMDTAKLWNWGSTVNVPAYLTAINIKDIFNDPMNHLKLFAVLDAAQTQKIKFPAAPILPERVGGWFLAE